MDDINAAAAADDDDDNDENSSCCRLYCDLVVLMFESHLILNCLKGLLFKK